jgi:hypothetical protein
MSQPAVLAGRALADTAESALAVVLFGGMPTVGKALRALPDPADHPTFQITRAVPVPARTKTLPRLGR